MGTDAPRQARRRQPPGGRSPAWPSGTRRLDVRARRSGSGQHFGCVAHGSRPRRSPGRLRGRSRAAARQRVSAIPKRLRHRTIAPAGPHGPVPSVVLPAYVRTFGGARLCARQVSGPPRTVQEAQPAAKHQCCSAGPECTAWRSPQREPAHAASDDPRHPALRARGFPAAPMAGRDVQASHIRREGGEHTTLERAVPGRSGGKEGC